MIQDNIRAFVQLGEFLANPNNKDIVEAWVYKAQSINSWFTVHNTQKSLQAINNYFCNEAKLMQWIASYNLEKVQKPKKVGLVLAGNIPAVGFHDILCVLISGHECLIKASSQDLVLIQELITLLKQFNPEFRINLVDKLNNAEALIATGSDNTAKHFEYYFRNIPHIIRKNRTSVGILQGNETKEDFENLGRDITDYFGLGCRNVSKIYVPSGYEFTSMLDTLAPFATIIEHHKYLNNYEYNKSIYLVNGVKHYDTGFLLLTENESLVSPISVLFYEEYKNEVDLQKKLANHTHKIQCVVAKAGLNSSYINFGQTQYPELWDYADGIDTMAFLMRYGF